MSSKRASRKRDPVYVRVMRLVDPATGEELGSFVPANSEEREVVRLRGYKLGTVMRAEFHHIRNAKFHRLVMKILGIVVENSDRLLNTDQLLTEIKIKLGRVDTTIDQSNGRVYYTLQSISFDDMDQDEFDKFYAELKPLLARDYFGGVPDRIVDEIAEMMEDKR